ncbi:primase-helicase family protein [Pseudomonas sp. AP-1]|uniref:primase-helicase family protein n=1 Tax=Pseudomonas sp. AP-1 TaxID=3231718 RepID=UPI0035B2792F
MSNNDSHNQGQAPRPAGIRLSAESHETLDLISEDFVLYAASDKPFYHKRSGDQLSEKGFKHYCAKHYGQVVVENQDKDGNATEKRLNSGELWGNPDFPAPSRRVVRRIIMEPTRTPESDCDPEVYNRWFVLKEEMAIADPSATFADIEIFIRHLMYISDNDQVGVMFFLCWLAQLYQTPDVKLPSAILFYSKFGGVGKTMLWKLLKEVFGRTMVGSCTGANLQKAFDDVTEHKRILFVNEMAKSDRADGYERFKNMISEEQVSFEGKGKAARDIRNITHYVVTTNNDDALPLMEGDRRVLVLRCTAQPKDDAYYKALAAWMEGPGPALLAGVLSRWQFPAEWDPKAAVPQTEASRAMQKANKGEQFSLIEELLESNSPPMNRAYFVARDLALELSQVYTGTRFTSQGVGKILERLGFKSTQQRVKPRDGGTGDWKPWVWSRPEHQKDWIDASAEERLQKLDSLTPAPHLTLVQGGGDHGRA